MENEDKSNEAPTEESAAPTEAVTDTTETGSVTDTPATEPQPEACDCESCCDEPDGTKVTEEDVLDAITNVESRTVELAGKPHTVTAVRLANGFTVVETSTAVDIKNYDPEIGERVNLEKIKSKVWLLLGYALQCKLAEENDVCKATVLRAVRELLEQALGEDSLSNEECQNGINLIDEVLCPGECHQSRARNELKELGTRIDKLTVFVASDKFASVPALEQQRMEKQLAAMRAYYTVLNQRVANFQVG